MWGLEVLGSDPTSCYSATHVVLAVDYRSQYFVAKTVSKLMSKHMIRFLKDQTIWLFRPPVQLVTDQGLIFMLREFQEYLRSNKMEHHSTFTYNSEGNALVEHMVGTLKIIPRQA